MANARNESDYLDDGDREGGMVTGAEFRKFQRETQQAQREIQQALQEV